MIFSFFVTSSVIAGRAPLAPAPREDFFLKTPFGDTMKRTLEDTFSKGLLFFNDPAAQQAHYL